MQEYETFCGRVSNGNFIGIGTSSAVDGFRLFSLLIHEDEALSVLWTVFLVSGLILCTFQYTVLCTMWCTVKFTIYCVVYSTVYCWFAHSPPQQVYLFKSMKRSADAFPMATGMWNGTSSALNGFRSSLHYFAHSPPEQVYSAVNVFRLSLHYFAHSPLWRTSSAVDAFRL